MAKRSFFRLGVSCCFVAFTFRTGLSFVGFGSSHLGAHVVRQPQVARQVNIGNVDYPTTNFRAETREKTDEELHTMIADSRKDLMLYRLQKFRKFEVGKKQKIVAGNVITLCKTVLKERELAKLKEEAEARAAAGEEEEVPIFANFFTEEQSENAFRSWYQLPHKDRRQKNQKHQQPSYYNHPTEKFRAKFHEVQAKMKAAKTAKMKASRGYKILSP